MVNVAPIISPFNLIERKLNHFGKRGLVLEEIRKLSLELVSPEEMHRRLGFKMYPAVEADFIPFFDIDGGLLKTDNKQFAMRFRRHLAEGEPNKYLSPKNSGSFAYLPQLEGIDWPCISVDVTEPLVIVEGEYKSIAACKRGITSVGLGGAWNFKSKQGGLCTPLDRFEFEGRTVCICYDADKESTHDRPYKTHVNKASLQLAAMLEKRGAKVFLLYIARTSKFVEGHKMGLDDYFDAGGEWDELMGTSSEPSMESQLAEMMRKYAVYMGGKPHILNLDTMAVYTNAEFENLVEVNKVRMDDKKVVPVARDFKLSKDRPEFDRYVFDPSGVNGLDQERRVFNNWPGFGSIPVRDEELESMYVKFMQKMCGEHYDYVVSWFAHMVQRPWEKTTIAMLCMSDVQGCGKSMLGEVHGALLGGGLYGSSPLSRVLSTTFNSLLANKILIQSDESDEFYANSGNQLKDLISSPTVDVEYKGKDVIKLANLLRLFITTNSDRPMRLDENNRRVFVWRPPVSVQDARGEWGRWVGEDIKALKDGERGCNAVMWYLMNWDLRGWDSTAPVKQTSEMHDLVDASPTKNDTVGDELYEHVMAEGLSWVAVNGLTSSLDKMVWLRFKRRVENGGGRKLKAQYTLDKRNQKVALFDLTGELEFTVDDTSNMWLAKGQIEGKTLALSVIKMAGMYNELANGIKHTDKY